MRTDTEQAPDLRGRKSKLILNAGLLVLAVSAIAATPSGDPGMGPLSEEEGDCIEITVYYWVLDENEEKQYLVDRCVPTNWTEAFRDGLEYRDGDVNSGVGFSVGVPLPGVA